MVITADCLVLVALQLNAVAVAEATNAVGSVMVTGTLDVQLLLSFI